MKGCQQKENVEIDLTSHFSDASEKSSSDEVDTGFESGEEDSDNNDELLPSIAKFYNPFNIWRVCTDVGPLFEGVCNTFKPYANFRHRSRQRDEETPFMKQFLKYKRPEPLLEYGPSFPYPSHDAVWCRFPSEIREFQRELAKKVLQFGYVWCERTRKWIHPVDVGGNGKVSKEVWNCNYMCQALEATTFSPMSTVTVPVNAGRRHGLQTVPFDKFMVDDECFSDEYKVYMNLDLGKRTIEQSFKNAIPYEAWEQPSQKKIHVSKEAMNAIHGLYLNPAEEEQSARIAYLSEIKASRSQKSQKSEDRKWSYTFRNISNVPIGIRVD